MTWFDEIQVAEGADEIDEWAARREYDLRYRRAERQREGLTAGVRKATLSMRNFAAAFAGDLAVPGMRKAVELAAEAEKRALIDAEEHGRETE